MVNGQVSPRAYAVMRHMAEECADRYVANSLLAELAAATGVPSPKIADIRRALDQPQLCLAAILGRYAFSRRGKDRDILAETARRSLERATSDHGMGALLAGAGGDRLWDAFDQLCRDEGRRSLEPLNRGILCGLLELAQEIYRQDGGGSIARWIADSIDRTDRVESQFLRLVEIRGVGPKVCSMLVRDCVFVYGLEERLDTMDRLYAQPIDKWLRLVASHVIPEPDADVMPDWILAGKIAKYARYAGVSGIRFNMGTHEFGANEVKTPHDFDTLLEQALIHDSQPA